MTFSLDLPARLAEHGARELALSQLNDASAARARLADPTDAEALHDFRVALRRLRSALRAYRSELRPNLKRATERRLRRLTDATRTSRDIEVHLQWLDQEQERFPATVTPGVSWLSNRLENAQRREWEAMLDVDADLFPSIHDRLAAELREFTTTVRVDESWRRRGMAGVAARRARKLAGRLRERLSRIHGYANDQEIHQARIAAKHLRYLLEPWEEPVPDGKEIVQQLKTLQDDFGEVHDTHVFRDELAGALAEATGTDGEAVGRDASPIYGLETLCRTLEERGQQAFSRAAANWLGRAPDRFFDSVGGMADSIAGLAADNREIERKYLLTGLPGLPDAEAPLEIEQGYLPGDKVMERVRHVTSPNGEQFIRTVKQGSGLARLEVEEELSRAAFDRMWPLTEGRRLRKRRYRVNDGALTWEVDDFLDRKLVIAEVELAPLAAPITLPAWLEPFVSRDVTEDESYSNFRLAGGDGAPLSSGAPLPPFPP